ncbi:hypothetical protein D3C86_2062160 [compost metagenome]
MHITLHSFELTSVDQWPHLATRIEPGPELQTVSLPGDPFQDLLIHPSLHIQTRTGDADLP